MILLAGNHFPPCNQLTPPRSEYVTVTDGVEALAHLITGPCEKIVLGEGLATLDALEVLELWRGVDQVTPVILFSGSNDLHALRRGVQLGISDFLLCGLDAEQLQDALERLAPSEAVRELDEDLLAPTPKLLTLYRTGIAQLSQRLSIQPCMAAGTILQRAIRQRMVRAYPWLKRFIPGKVPANTRADLEMQLSEEFAILHTLFPKEASQSFREILTYILTHMDREPHQPEISDAFYLSSSTLSQMFTRELGCGFRSYVTECRMLRAASLLSELEAAKVAEQLGYQDYSYFTKQFRKRFGLFPAEYQSNVRKERTSCTQPIE